MKIHKLAIIGCGKVAHLHAKAIGNLPDANLAAVWSRTPALGTINMLGWRDKAYYDSDPWRGTWDMEGGGVLVNQAPHQLDILLWFMGEVDEVYGLWSNLNHPYIDVDG